MSFDDQLVERIVAGVLEKLRTPSDQSASPAHTSHDSPTATASPSNGAPSLSLSDAVITAETLAGKLIGIKQLIVGKKTVLTPTALDELRNHKITWTRDAASASTKSSNANWKVIVVHETPAVVQAVEATTGTRELAGCSPDASKLAVSAICRAESAGVVVISKHAASIACRMNRNAKIRAAAVDDVPSAQWARKQLGTNVWCVSPEGKSGFELRNLLRELTGTAPQVPSHWTEL